MLPSVIGVYPVSWSRSHAWSSVRPVDIDDGVDDVGLLDNMVDLCGDDGVARPLGAHGRGATQWAGGASGHAVRARGIQRV